MVIPRTFRNDRERSIVTYDFSELASGEGVIEYNGFQSKDIVTNDYHLSQSSVYSNKPDTVVTTSGGGAFAKDMDLDFDLSVFNTPVTIRGTASINIPFALNHAAGPTNQEAYLIVKVVHYDGSTETILGTAQSETIIQSGGTYTGRIAMMSIDIAKTNFKIGETLRLIVEGWTKTGGALTLAIGHDPKGRTGDDTGSILTAQASTPTTQMTAKIPFKIDL